MELSAFYCMRWFHAMVDAMILPLARALLTWGFMLSIQEIIMERQYIACCAGLLHTTFSFAAPSSSSKFTL